VRWAAVLCSAAPLLLPVWNLTHNYAANDRSRDTAAATHFDALFDALPGRAVLVHEQRHHVVLQAGHHLAGERLLTEGLAADVTMLVGNGYVPGHADTALRLLREHPGVQRLFQARH